jgi:hypothetical protein
MDDNSGDKIIEDLSNRFDDMIGDIVENECGDRFDDNSGDTPSSTNKRLRQFERQCPG